MNTYSDFGNSIDSGRYVNRLELEEIAFSRMMDAKVYGSMSVVGMQRSGKSTFAQNFLLNRKGELLKENTIVIKIDMSHYKDPQRFFKALIQDVFDILMMNEWVDKVIEWLYNRAIQDNFTDSGGKSLFSFFEGVHRKGFKVILILDEFDNAQEIFKSFGEGFQYLRSLAYEPDYKLAMLILSRRQVAEIQLRTCGISTFDNILLERYITAFKQDEAQRYFDILGRQGINLTNELKEQYRIISGYYPFWMDFISFHLLNHGEEQMSVEIIYEDCIKFFYENFGRMLKLLEEQGLLNPLFQFRFGPLHDASVEALNQLNSYGLLVKDEQTQRYIGFCEKFDEFLMLKQVDVDYYPLWNKTEKMLRKLAIDIFIDKYGINWETQLETKYRREANGQKIRILNGNERPTLWKLISDASRTNLTFSNSWFFNKKRQLTFVDGLTTGGLGELIASEWNLFRHVFNESKESWEIKSKHLTRARNPYAHNNDDLMDRSFKDQTKLYCQEFINKMEVHDKKIAR